MSAFDVVLEKAEMLAPTVRELVLRRVDGAPMEFAAGQWVNLLFEVGGEDLKRSYSIASRPDGSPRFELAVTRVVGGPISERLHALQVGETVRAVGPSGFFTREPTSPKKALFVGTGTGVAPLRSMLQAAIAAGSKTEMTLLLGVRHEADILYREELEALATQHGNVQFHVTLSKPPPTWTGRSGHVQQHVPELVDALGKEDLEVYICGLERMVKSVKELCRGPLALGRREVHQERYD
jgi:ferredoxin-NADP reductase